LIANAEDEDERGWCEQARLVFLTVVGAGRQAGAHMASFDVCGHIRRFVYTRRPLWPQTTASLTLRMRTCASCAPVDSCFKQLPAVLSRKESPQSIEPSCLRATLEPVLPTRNLHTPGCSPPRPVAAPVDEACGVRLFAE